MYSIYVVYVFLRLRVFRMSVCGVVIPVVAQIVNRHLRQTSARARIASRVTPRRDEQRESRNNTLLANIHERAPGYSCELPHGSRRRRRRGEKNHHAINKQRTNAAASGSESFLVGAPRNGSCVQQIPYIMHVCAKLAQNACGRLPRV